MRLWSFIFALALAIGLGVLIHQDPGYAFFAYGNWTVEMPLWVSVFVIILAVALILFVLWTNHIVFSSGRRVKAWWKHHKENTARLQTYRGLLELAEGRWKQAERYLIQGASNNDTPLINYLSAAKAATESGSMERRDQYLQLARDIQSDSDVTVQLTQAELQLAHHETEAAIQTLKALPPQAANKHPKILRLLYSAYESTNDWQSLFALLPTLHKNQVFPKDVLEKLEQKIYPQILPNFARKGPQALVAFWQDIPHAIQSDPHVISIYTQLLMRLSLDDVAELVVRTGLKHTWSDELIRLYGFIDSQYIKKQLVFAESFLPEKNDPILLLTLGRLCVRNELWGKARSYFEQSLALKPITETYAELGQLMEQLGQFDKRDEYFKKGLIEATQMIHPTPLTTSPENALLYLAYEDKKE